MKSLAQGKLKSFKIFNNIFMLVMHICLFKYFMVDCEISIVVPDLTYVRKLLFACMNNMLRNLVLL